MTAAPVTLLFTDLAHSTALLHRVGDERAQRILRAHRQVLQEAIAGHGGGDDDTCSDADQVGPFTRCGL